MVANNKREYFYIFEWLLVIKEFFKYMKFVFQSTIVFLEQAHWLHVVCGCFFGVIMGPSSCDRSYGLHSLKY